ncbi:MAG TPA: hypothetical protein VFR24_10290 [Candidatus Angelobacter sp.]|nr:hypothetical protein [Candidatus Angelobacter sp.]
MLDCALAADVSINGYVVWWVRKNGVSAFAAHERLIAVFLESIAAQDSVPA